MSLFSSVVHSIQHALGQVEQPVGNLFDGKTALARALVNPADAVAVGQTLDNTAIKGETPQTQAKNTVATGDHLVATIGAYHQDLWNAITDALHWLGHQISAVKRSAYRLVRVKGNKVGDNIHSTIKKWGGERRVIGWAVFAVGLVILIIVNFFSVGLSTPATVAWTTFGMAMLSYGLQNGLTPDPAAPPKLPLFLRGADNNIDNSKITSITDLGGSSGGAQSGSTLQDLLNSLGLGGLSGVAVAGVAVAGVAGLYFLLKR